MVCTNELKKIVFLDNSGFIAHALRYDLISSFIKTHEINLYYVIDKFEDNNQILSNNENFFHSILNLKSFLKLIFKLKKTDFILTFTVRPLIIGFLLKLISPKIKFYPTLTGIGPLADSKKVIYKILRLCYPIILSKANHVFTHNESDARFISNFLEKKNYSVVGGSGISIPKFQLSRKPYNNPKIACFSRLIKDKGVVHYLEATKLILKEFPFLKGNIVLAGRKYKANFKSNTVSDKEIDDWIKCGGIYIGQPTNKNKFYSSNDVICLPSYREGLSNVLLEGGSNGCILMTTNVPGCKDVVCNNSGVLFEPKSTHSLYIAIKRIINLNPQEQKDFRINCFNKIKNKFSKEKVIESYHKILGIE